MVSFPRWFGYPHDNRFQGLGKILSLNFWTRFLNPFWSTKNSFKYHLKHQPKSFQTPALILLHLGPTVVAHRAFHVEENRQANPCPSCTPGFGLASVLHHGLGHCAIVISLSSTIISPNPGHARRLCCLNKP